MLDIRRYGKMSGLSFEEWGEKCETGTHPIDIDYMYADWKAEREKQQKYIEHLEGKLDENRDDYIEERRERLVEALVRAAVPLEAIAASVECELAPVVLAFRPNLCHCDMVEIETAIQTIRSTLAKVMGK
jgi:hypothetical protein